jgi:tryptophan synthase alpha chain
MTRIADIFEKTSKKGEKALVGFVTAGDPDMALSLEIVRTLIKNGVDILELGVPFSDPTADGPVIQRASARALKSGATLEKILDMTAVLRSETDIPIILFSYYNPILSYGRKRFYIDAVKAGADGVLLVDLPPEESEELTARFAGNELSLIRLVAPTTPRDRMPSVVSAASGFIYMISKTGVTGSAGLQPLRIEDQVRSLRAATSLPICIGFGISTPDDVRSLAPMADGVVVGSAFVKVIEENLGTDGLLDKLAEKVAGLKAAARMQ